jgi:hypothetical protein
MKPFRIEQLITDSRRIETVLPELTQFVLSWLDRKGEQVKLRASIAEFHRQWFKLERDGLMDNAEERLLEQLAMCRAFSDPHTGRDVQHAAEAAGGVSNEALDFLKTAAEEPWFVTAFECIEPVGENLLRYVDYDDNNHYLVYSPRLSELFQKGVGTCYGLFLYNGSCFQLFGPLYTLHWADKKDLQWYARRLDEQLYDREGLMDVMTSYLVSFAALSAYSELPPGLQPEHSTELCDAEAPLSRLREENLPPGADVQRRGRLVRILLDAENPGYGPRAVWDGKHKRLLLRAWSADAYQRGRELLHHTAELPALPQRHCSGKMAAAAADVLGPDEFAGFEQQFEKQ